MKKFNCFYKENISWILSPLATLGMMLVIYMIRGIYPFGDVDVSYQDLSQSFIPIYAHTYDFFCGKQGVFWDWYNCGGVSMADVFGNFIINPFNLILLFGKRDKFLEFMSYFLLLKVCFSSFSMSLCIHKKYEALSNDWKVIIGVIYASSGYIIQYYTNIQFLDTVAVFPLIMLSIDLLIKSGKRIWLIIFLCIGFTSNMQLMIMVCIYCIIYSFIYMIGNSEAKKNIVSLGLCVLFSISISLVVIFPTILSNIGTSRVDVSNNIIRVNLYNMLINAYINQRLFMCYGIEVVVAFLSVYVFLQKIVHYKEVKREFILFVLLLLPVFIDCINIVWHIVGYMAFPMRFGFMLTFSALLLLAKILVSIKTEEKKAMIGRNVLALGIGGIGLAVMLYSLLPLREYGEVEVDMYVRYGVGLITLILSYALILVVKASNKTVMALIVCQCMLGWLILLAPQNDAYQPEMASDYIVQSQELSEIVSQMTSEDTRVARVRDDSVSLNTNYPVLLQNSAISGWYNGCNGNLRYFVQKLGFGANYTRLLGTGATVFSDAIFHTRKIISYNDSEIANHIVAKQGDYYLKETDIYYPYGILVDNNILGWRDEEKNAFLYQNKLFDAIHNADNPELFSVYDKAEICVNDNELIEGGWYYSVYQIDVSNSKILYVKGRKTGSNTFQMGVNGELVYINDLLASDNTVYPGYFNNGIISLGLFEDETVLFEIVSSEPIAEEEISIAAMDINLLKEKTEEQHKYEREITPTNNGLKYKVNNTDGYPYLLLPIGFQDKFWCKVNGKFVECEPCVEDALTLIPIEEGMNEISIVYIPRGLITGAIISVIGLIVLIIMWKRWDAIIEIKWLQNVANVCFIVLFGAMIVCVYILPTVAEIVLRVIGYLSGI